MPIIKQERYTGNFTILSNDIPNDPTLSGRAKSIMWYLLTKPPGWVIVIEDIVNHMKEGRDSITSSLRELRNAGYIWDDVIRGSDGRIVTRIMTASEVKRGNLQNSPQTGLPVMRLNPIEDKPALVNTESIYSEHSDSLEKKVNIEKEAKRETDAEDGPPQGSLFNDGFTNYYLPSDLYGIILRNGELHIPTNADVERYKRLYPSIDVEFQLTQIAEWNADDKNKAKRKTPNGVKQHIRTWLADEEQDAQRKRKQSDSRAMPTAGRSFND